ANERPPERARAVGEVLALHVHAVERVGRAREAHGVDGVQRELAGLERRARGLPRELLAGLLRPPHEPGHAGAHGRDPPGAHRGALAYSMMPRVLPSGSAKCTNRAYPCASPSESSNRTPRVSRSRRTASRSSTRNTTVPPGERRRPLPGPCRPSLAAPASNSAHSSPVRNSSFSPSTSR